MKVNWRHYPVIAGTALLPGMLWASGRFPKPDFEQTGHEVPTATHPSPLPQFMEYLDVGILLFALSLTAWMVHKRRSRAGVFCIMVASLAYFGFYRNGCICAVGSVQNVALAIGQSGYAIPLTVVLVFALPLLFALFFGRVFCAAVCPLGAIQDAVVIRNPLRLPAWLNESLSLLPYLYLSTAVLFACTGASFIICRFDPFVGFFRFSGHGNMLIIGGLLLVIGVFIARPYCRFLCPYGVILNWMSRLSLRQVSTTPASCVNCRLCESSCPFDALDQPMPKPVDPRPRARKRLTRLLLLTPFVVAVGTILGLSLHHRFARVHPDVRLAEMVQLVKEEGVKNSTPETEAFLGSGEPLTQLYARASEVVGRMKVGAGLVGAFLGLVIMLRLIRLSVHRTRTDYHPDQGRCLACARCFPYCPVPPVEPDKDMIQTVDGS